MTSREAHLHPDGRPVDVLVVDDDALGSRMAERLLTRRGFVCRTAGDGHQALQAMRDDVPDVVLLDVHMEPMSGPEVLRALQRDYRTALVPVICVTGDRRSDTLMDLLYAGADDYIAKPYDIDELIARIVVATRRRLFLGGVSPLTGLPGNVLLTRGVEQRLDAGSDFALLHVDLDNFKPFNDRYGYVQGDAVIQGLADVLRDAVSAADRPHVVLGHIGGDDFGVVCDAPLALGLAHDVVARFDAIAPAFHDADDRRRNGMTIRDRRGELRTFPLLSVSIGVARWTAEHPRNAKAVADVASEMKGVAKRKPGSGVAVDRRRPPGRAPAGDSVGP